MLVREGVGGKGEGVVTPSIPFLDLPVFFTSFLWKSVYTLSISVSEMQ